MNQLDVKIKQSTYTDVDHPCIFIDGVELDIWLDQLYPNHYYLGLIPCITDWMDTEAEQQLVIQRYIDKQDIVILPILMCPDDCDLWCTVIVAEVIQKQNKIWWNRIGVDRSDIKLSYHNFGHTVEWFEHIPPFIFDKQTYYNELDRIYLPVQS